MIGDIQAALTHTHKKGIVHCDIKPENVLVWENRQNGFEAALTDFGAAKENDGQYFIDNGTPLYMAPEVLLSYTHIYAGMRVKLSVIDAEWYPEDKKNRIDYFSFACVCFFLRYGGDLFGGNHDIKAQRIERLKFLHFGPKAYVKKRLDELEVKITNREHIDAIATMLSTPMMDAVEDFKSNKNLPESDDLEDILGTQYEDFFKSKAKSRERERSN